MAKTLASESKGGKGEAKKDGSKKKKHVCKQVRERKGEVDKKQTLRGEEGGKAQASEDRRKGRIEQGGNVGS